MSEIADITIIGAGVIGLAIASEVAGSNRDVYVLEKNETFGQEQSGRSSEVIHAGIYYQKDSLKTSMCLEGNRLISEVCEKNGIFYRKCGKIFVAIDSLEAEMLERLYKNGRDNGLPLEMLSQREMRQLEPNMRGVTAFLSPTSGVLDSHALMRYFLGKAQDSGARMVFKAKVVGIEKVSEGYEVRLNDTSGDTAFITRILINCAGLYSDRIAGMTGINIDEAEYRLNWYKGEYYSVSGGKNKLINRLIYPVPGVIGPGIHICLDADWRLRLGPLFYEIDKIDYKIDDSRKNIFLQSSLLKALPFIESSDLEPESSGILAMLNKQGESSIDFIIRHEQDRGLSGFINLIGIDSPGLTASPAIAKYVGKLVNEMG
jgi:L-2-hydroxyglutarate oxidase LhgO